MVTLVVPSTNGRLPIGEMRRRAANVGLVLCDVDGTLTDGGVYYSAQGEELKRFNLRDGMGVERLRERGIETLLISRESSPIVQQRAEKLNVQLVCGVRDKARALPGILERGRLSMHQIAYIGDDANDLEIMTAIHPAGLIAAPADAFVEIRDLAHHVCAAFGGHGAFRELAELIISFLDTDRTGRGKKP